MAMLIGAVLIGLLTAYYFGLRVGIIAAGISAAMFFLAAIVPGVSLGIYGLIGLFVAGVCLAGPKLANKEEQKERKNLLRRWGRQLLGKAWRRL